MSKTLFLLVAAYLTAAHLTEASNFGVGFDLSLDYGYVDDKSPAYIT